MASPAHGPASSGPAAPGLVLPLQAGAFAAMLASPFLSDVALRLAEPDTQWPIGIPTGDAAPPPAVSPGDVGREVPAHRVVLAASSPTFRAMFSSGMQESTSGVVDVSFPWPVVECLLHYLYSSDECRRLLTQANAVGVLEASCYFQLEPLKDAAVGVIRSAITPHNVLQLLSVALSFACDRLRDVCLSFIRQHNTPVLDADAWPALPKAVALLLIRETVIDSDLRILRRSHDWCLAEARRIEATSTSTDEPALTEAGASSAAALLQDFVEYVDFTAMTPEEIAVVEGLDCVPLEFLYRAFKAHCLGSPAPNVPRHGGIVLQWEPALGPSATDVLIVNNHVTKRAADFHPCTVTAMNKFAAGVHYLTFAINDVRTPHDCLVGVRCRAPEVEVLFDPSTGAVTAIPSSALAVTVEHRPGRFAPPPRHDGSDGASDVEPEPRSILVDYCAVVGVLLDFDAHAVRFIDHVTKQPLASVRAHGALPAPLLPTATLYHRTNGGVTMSDATTYPAEAARPAQTTRRALSLPSSANSTPMKYTSPSRAGS